MQAIVHGICSAGRNQLYINQRARSPGIALVDRIAVLVDALRAIKVRGLLDRTFAVLLDLSAPEEDLTFVVGGLQFQPDVEGIHCACREEVSNFARAHHYIDPLRVATA